MAQNNTTTPSPPADTSADSTVFSVASASTDGSISSSVVVNDPPHADSSPPTAAYSAPAAAYSAPAAAYSAPAAAYSAPAAAYSAPAAAFSALSAPVTYPTVPFPTYGSYPYAYSTYSEPTEQPKP
ncbi:hypothetical protein BC937DRAFT_94707 [Endogone sp. FLAS-F59071]|nr:hypothetical protein BC937DRAFT_94707 [Endogone sp. FLAS-F59071]|eukprot:RUS13833.1 hypothetical protein BC937DRAFT_94707 [Endogone sp. FLAS-F59071]